MRGSDSYKFAELVPAGPGKFKLSADYIPPTTAISASHSLARWTRACATCWSRAGGTSPR